MAFLPLNIERNTLRKGEYIGYAAGAWTVRRSRGGGWLAIKQSGERATRFGKTLSDLGSKLDCYREVQEHLATLETA